MENDKLDYETLREKYGSSELRFQKLKPGRFSRSPNDWKKLESEMDSLSREIQWLAEEKYGNLRAFARELEKDFGLSLSRIYQGYLKDIQSTLINGIFDNPKDSLRKEKLGTILDRLDVPFDSDLVTRIKDMAGGDFKYPPSDDYSHPLVRNRIEDKLSQLEEPYFIVVEQVIDAYLSAQK